MANINRYDGVRYHVTIWPRCRAVQGGSQRFCALCENSHDVLRFTIPFRRTNATNKLLQTNTCYMRNMARVEVSLDAQAEPTQSGAKTLRSAQPG